MTPLARLSRWTRLSWWSWLLQGPNAVEGSGAGRLRIEGRKLRATVAVVLLLGVLSAWLSGHLGWFGRSVVWQDATGWNLMAIEDQPARVSSWAPLGEDFSVHWLGHAGFRIAWQGTVLALDPNLSSRCSIAPRWTAVPDSGHDLGEVDAVLISHAHLDHLDLPTVRSIDPDRLVMPSGASGFVGSALGPITEELAVGDSMRVGALKVTAVRAAHHGHRLHPFSSRAQAVGYVIQSRGRSIYFAGDTGFENPWSELRRRFRPDMAILPIGAFSPRRPLATYHLSPEEAALAADQLGVELVIPSHFGTFTLSLDRPDQALPRFARAASGSASETVGDRRHWSWRMPVLWTGGGAL